MIANEDLAIMSLLDLLSRLQPSLLSEYASLVYEEQHFGENTALPEHFSTHLIHLETRMGVKVHHLIDQVSDGIRKLIEKRERDEEMYSILAKQFWLGLRSRNIECVGAMLFGLLCSCESDAATKTETLKLRASAASCVFVLCSLEGATARLFHSQLLIEALKVLKTDKLSLRKGRKRRNRTPNRTAKRRASLGRVSLHCSRLGSTQESEINEDLRMDESIEEQQQICLITNCLERALYHLLLMLRALPLRDYADVREQLVSVLTDLTRSETNHSNLEFAEKQRNSDGSSIAFNAYIGLERLCSNFMHGSKDQNARLLLHKLMPSVLMSFDGADLLTPKCLNSLRQHTVNFVLHLLKIVGVEVQEAVILLIQHLALSVQDKAEIRGRVCQSICKIIDSLPENLWNDVREWFQKATWVERVSLRHFALEVLPHLLQSPFESTIDGMSFSVIFARLYDSAPTVKAKALQAINELLEDDKSTLDRLLNSQINDTQREEEHFFRTLPEIVASLDDSREIGSPVPPKHLLIRVIGSKTNDESVWVRKAALALIGSFLRRELSWCLLKAVSARSRDTSVTIRRQVASLLSELLNASPSNEELVPVFVQALFPMMLDNEIRASEKALEYVYSSLFGNLEAHEEDDNSNERALSELPWILLRSASKQGLTEYLSQACRHWTNQGLITKTIFPIIKSHIGHEHSKDAWLLLTTLTKHLKLSKPAFVVQHFARFCSRDMEVSLFEVLQVLKVLLSSLRFLEAETRNRLKKFLIKLISEFKLPLELISASVDIVAVATQVENRNDDGIDGRHTWAQKLIQRIEGELDQRVCETMPAEGGTEEHFLLNTLLTLGELALLAPEEITQKLYETVHALVFYKQGGTSVPCMDLGDFLPGSRLRAVAVLTLNKICFHHETMAKATVPSFAYLLQSVEVDKSIKQNVMYSLSDMCARYASVVDPLVPSMTSSLSHECKEVRKCSVLTLVHLLQEDYLKIRNTPTFFFRLVQVLNDRDEEVSNLCRFYLVQRLFKRQPKICYQHFVESLFFFNEYEGHPKYKLSSDAVPLHSIKGVGEERIQIYKFLLEHMSDHERFHCTHNLCQEILNAIIENVIELNDSSRSLITDTLALLGSDDIKLSSLRRTANDDPMNTTNAEESSSNNEADLVDAAKKTIISQLVRKNVMEHIVPILVALKRILERNNESSLLKHLMICLRELMKDYKNELRDVFVGDVSLATEIAEEIKQFEEQHHNSQCDPNALIARRRQSRNESNDLLRTILDREQTRARSREEALSEVEERGDNISDLSSLPLNILNTATFTPAIVLQDIRANQPSG